MNDAQLQQRLRVALLTLRLSVFVVLAMWTLDKFVNPGHAGAVFAHFYAIKGVGHASLIVIGGLETLLILLFVAGMFKRWTYAGVLLIHAMSTIASWHQYLHPFKSLLFFAAWPMLGACIALYLLRDADTLASLDRYVGASRSAGDD